MVATRILVNIVWRAAVCLLAAQIAFPASGRPAPERAWSSGRSSESSTDGYLICISRRGSSIDITGAAAFDRFPFEWRAKLKPAGKSFIATVEDDYKNRYLVKLRYAGGHRALGIFLRRYGTDPDARQAAVSSGWYRLRSGPNSACW